MMSNVVLLVVIAAVLVSSTSAQNCTCETGRIEVCATDLNTYKVKEPRCLKNCNLGVLYAGSCECPNNCLEHVGFGLCKVDGDGKRSCTCREGRGGADCSSVRCPNSCNSNGVCITAAVGVDVCKCNPGYTGADCATPEEVELSQSPVYFGEAVEGKPYHRKDKYEDLHPFFKPSVVAQVKLYTDRSNLIYCETVGNELNQTAVPGSLVFNNGEITKQFKVSFHIKGSTSRFNVEKQWSVKFDKSWEDIKGFGLKSCGSPVLVYRNFIAHQLYRSMQVPTHRTSMTELYINDVFYGLYLLQERLDSHYYEARYGKTDVNHMYKLVGIDLTPSAERIEKAKEAGDADQNKTRLISLMNALSTPATSNIAHYLDINSVIRHLVVETYIVNVDGCFLNSNNYGILETRPNYWKPFVYDFDQAFNYGYITIKGLNLKSIFSIWNVSRRPLMNAIKATPHANITFVSYFNSLVSILQDQKVEAYFQSVVRLLVPVVQQDAANFGGFTVPVIEKSRNDFTKMLQTRTNEVAEELASFILTKK